MADHANQLEDRMIEKYKTMVEKQNDRVNNLQSAAFELANYYFVSQAVIFTALAAGSSTLKCRHVWFPLVLSLVPAFLNFFALVVIGKAYKSAIRILEEYTCKHEEYVTRQDRRRRNEQDEIGERFVGADPELLRSITFKFYACMVSFAFFAIVVAFGSISILCLEKN